MIQQMTQDPTYWGDDFKITPDDLQVLGTLLMEEELPRSAEELAKALIAHHCQKEEALVQCAMSKGTPYQPRRSYEKGEKVVFPALDYRIGEVVGMRTGHNPEYGAFKVIKVKFDEGKPIEFAAELTVDHPLNQDSPASPSEDKTHSKEELADLYGPQIGRLLEKRLESEGSFIRLACKWFPKDLLVDVHVGHLNLAEAVLDMNNGGPLPTEDLLGDLELPEKITPQLRVFSLNYALQEDERFDEVGPAGQVLWFLHRLEPGIVRAIPDHLRCQTAEYDHALLTSEMLALEKQIDDEWSNLPFQEEPSEPVTVVLTFPHWKSGTLPISSRLAPIFPTGRTQRIRFLWKDADTGDEMPGWVVREGRYMVGLNEWYRAHSIPVGAYLEVARGEKPGVMTIRPSSQRARREWIRVALPVEGRLTFEMRKELITCEYDELIIVAEESPEATEAVWTRTRVKKLSLGQLTAEIFPELAKLSPQGTVHAATLYSAINLAMRTPPGPLLANLVASDTYAPVGDNYWVLQASHSGV